MLSLFWGNTLTEDRKGIVIRREGPASKGDNAFARPDLLKFVKHILELAQLNLKALGNTRECEMLRPVS